MLSTSSRLGTAIVASIAVLVMAGCTAGTDTADVKESQSSPMANRDTPERTKPIRIIYDTDGKSVGLQKAPGTPYGKSVG